MVYPDLQSFVEALESAGQLKRITTAVDPVLEITEITDRVSKSPAAGDAPPPNTDPVHGQLGGHGLLFENVTGSSMPLAINLYGSYERMRMALGCDSFEAVADRVRDLIKPQMPTTLLAKMKKLPDLVKLAGFGPKSVKTGICQQVTHTDDANLNDLPIMQCWPEDGGRYITFAGVYTVALDTGVKNVGMYRVQLFEPKLMAVHWHMHHDGAAHFRKYAARGEPMPVAIVFGGEPVLPYAATCPLPPDVSELLFAGFLNGGGIELVKCKTIDMEVPANAEIVIEGLVDPAEKLLEGPFGDHTGFYSLADHYPAFRVTAITHRRDPIYPSTIVGKPPQEDYYLGKATERIFLPLLKMAMPDVLDYSLPMYGAFHNCAFIKIRKEYPMQARRVMSAIWGAGQMSFTKLIIVVDEHVNVHDEHEVMFHVGANWDPRRDTMMVDGPLDILDHASPYCGSGAKMGIDATRKIPGEGLIREWPAEIEMCESIKQLVSGRWQEYGL
ncbi:MAG: menaquinone biosynthesis decarboxylase [Phycisphaerae bacterium]|nr:menaquinone biosynthesis decarboxylase [Phycisphaerae bacterium]